MSLIHDSDVLREGATAHLPFLHLRLTALPPYRPTAASPPAASPPAASPPAASPPAASSTAASPTAASSTAAVSTAASSTARLPPPDGAPIHAPRAPGATTRAAMCPVLPMTRGATLPRGARTQAPWSPTHHAGTPNHSARRRAIRFRMLAARSRPARPCLRPEVPSRSDCRTRP